MENENLVLVYSETCIQAGKVAVAEMNSEEFAFCEGNKDELAEVFGDCHALDRETARIWASIPIDNVGRISNLPHRLYMARAGENALAYFPGT
jgi:hypothetical protein